MIVAIVPARLGSSRLPRKALADIGGKPMIVRTWERAMAAGLDRVIVATDSEEIVAVIRGAGGEAVMTPPAESGTDRVAWVARSLPAKVVVNVQGDEPFIDPGLVRSVANAVGAATPIATAAAPLHGDPQDPSKVKVVCDCNGNALYFSRSAIPSGGPWRLHLGIYAFSAETLQAMAALPPSALERGERLEQLRWLEGGQRIAVVPTHHATAGVDTQEDLDRVRASLREP